MPQRRRFTIAAKYGVPYKGGKNAIADWVVSHLPSANVLIDLFCGGCSVTHAALLSGKWQRIIANDINISVPQLFVDAVRGKYTTENERRWISREDFFRLKDTDAYVRWCWSFSSGGKTYLYGREVEPYKRAVHAIITGETVHERRMAWRAFVRLARSGVKIPSEPQYLEAVERMEALERLEHLQFMERLTVSGKDYRDVPILPDAVVYCDIPYNCTTTNYETPFNYAAFFDWACAQTVPVVISEYNIPDERFAILAETEKRQTSAGAKYQKLVKERLYVPRHQLETVKAMSNSQ